MPIVIGPFEHLDRPHEVRAKAHLEALRDLAYMSELGLEVWWSPS